MQDFLDETWVNKPEANNIATRVFLVVPVSYKDVTKRSIKDLFAHFHDHWYRNPQGNFEGAFTVAHLRKFYTDPNAVIDMRLRGLIPPPKPVAQNPVAMALHLVHDPLSLKTKYLLESCNANTCAWVTLAVAKAQVLDKRVTSLDCKNFPPKNPDRPFTTKFGIRFPNHDSILPEDSYDLEGTAARTVVRYFNKMEFTDVEGFFPDSYAEMQSILDVFPHHTLPVARTVWANWDSEQTLSNLVFCGLGQYYLTAARSAVKPATAVFEVDLSSLAAYAVRPGFEKYGAIAFFNAQRKCCGIHWTSKNKLVLPGEADFPHVSVLFRSTMNFFCALGNHLVHIHWIVSNGLVGAAERFLGATHPIRRLVKPHTFNTVAVNLSSFFVLADFNGIAGRAFALTESSWDQMLVDLIATFKYETIEEHFAASGLDAAMAKELPLYQDGIGLWNITSDYVRRYVDIHYSSEESVATDADLKDYWQCLSTHIPNRDYGLGPLTKVNLIKQLTHSIFYVTAWHQLFGGGLAEYLMDTKGSVFRAIVFVLVVMKLFIY
jgi:hypothetical protein